MHRFVLLMSREVAELERRRREARTTGARAIEGRAHVEDVVPALRADLRERVGDAVRPRGASAIGRRRRSKARLCGNS